MRLTQNYHQTFEYCSNRSRITEMKIGKFTHVGQRRQNDGYQYNGIIIIIAQKK
jgi:hypothetical protein